MLAAIEFMTIDGQWALIGSANWDMRSLRLNFELDLEAYTAGLVVEIDELIRAHQCQRISASALASRPLASRLRDGAARLLLPYL